MTEVVSVALVVVFFLDVRCKKQGKQVATKPFLRCKGENPYLSCAVGETAGLCDADADAAAAGRYLSD